MPVAQPPDGTTIFLLWFALPVLVVTTIVLTVASLRLARAQKRQLGADLMMRRAYDALEARVLSGTDELNEARQRVVEARVRVEQATTLRDRFLATISHELRTPLNAILGWTRLLRTGLVESSERGLAAIERNAALEAHLIDDLLDVSRIAQGRFSIQPKPVDLRLITRDAVAVLSAVASEKGVILDADVGERGRPITVWGDEVRLQQLISNLLANAVKFSKRGARVRIGLRATSTVAEVVVQDSGEGIDQAFLPHVFDPFRQDASGPTRTGLGLGLSIVREIVRRHGGRVRVNSTGRGSGATFTVALPLHEERPLTEARRGLPAQIATRVRSRA